MALGLAVDVDGLSRHFGSIEAVSGVTFQVLRGELFGIVGPNGAGKTTTLRMLAGVLRPTAGDARIADVSVARDPEGVKRHIAYMSQRFGLYGDLTCPRTTGPHDWSVCTDSRGSVRSSIAWPGSCRVA